MALDDDVLDHPELYPCHIVYQYLKYVRPDINDFLKLAIIDRHFDLQHIFDDNCILLQYRNEIIDDMFA
jgi:hypothetical protein